MRGKDSGQFEQRNQSTPSLGQEMQIRVFKVVNLKRVNCT